MRDQDPVTMSSKRFLKNNLVQINADVYEFGKIRKSFFGRGRCIDCGYKDNRFNSYKLIDHLSSKHSDIYDIKLLTPDYDVNIHTGQIISSPQARENGVNDQTDTESSRPLKAPRAAKKSVINFAAAPTNKLPTNLPFCNDEPESLPRNRQSNGEPENSPRNRQSNGEGVSCDQISSSTNRSPPEKPPKNQAFQSLDDIIDRIRRDRERMNQKADAASPVDDDDDDDVEIVLVTPYKGLSSHRTAC